MIADGLTVVGATGRLGSAVVRACARAEVEVVASITRAGRHTHTTATPAVVIDASRPAALADTLAYCDETGSALLYCVSNPGSEGLQLLRTASTRFPVGLVANLSPLQWVQSRAAELMSRLASDLGFDAEFTVIDRHPVTKLDAPSATARRLADLLSQPTTVVAERFGPAVCDHRVVLSVRGETCELTHSVRNLDLVGDAAVRLAAVLATAPRGLHTVDDLYTQLTRQRERI